MCIYEYRYVSRRREGGRGGRGTEGERERAREKETETKYEGVTEANHKGLYTCIGNPDSTV